MTALLLDGLTALLLAAGILFGISGAVGVHRFPDFYTRIHAAGVTDTLSAGAILVGLMLQAGFTLVSVKLLFIMVFMLYTAPVASHALARAAEHSGVKPLLSDGEEPPSHI